MITAKAEADIRAITELARGCEKSHGKKQTAMLFGALADRLDAFINEHGEATYRAHALSGASMLAMMHRATRP